MSTLHVYADEGVPNLDAMSPEDLLNFCHAHVHGRGYRQLGFEGKGAKTAAGDLANYASNKATAMVCRRAGDVQTALTYETICDRIFSELPEWARW